MEKMNYTVIEKSIFTAVSNNGL